MITNDRKSAGRSIRDLISEARNIPDKLDDAFEGMIDDDAFIDGWFAVRKISGRIITTNIFYPVIFLLEALYYLKFKPFY